jgi:hypothetical protein
MTFQISCLFLFAFVHELLAELDLLKQSSLGLWLLMFPFKSQPIIFVTDWKPIFSSHDMLMSSAGWVVDSDYPFSLE